MIYRRYLHALVQLYNRVFAIGGFYHSDLPGKEPYSLASCEVFNLKTHKWNEV